MQLPCELNELIVILGLIICRFIAGISSLLKGEFYKWIRCAWIFIVYPQVGNSAIIIAWVVSLVMTKSWERWEDTCEITIIKPPSFKLPHVLRLIVRVNVQFVMSSRFAVKNTANQIELVNFKLKSVTTRTKKAELSISF